MKANPVTTTIECIWGDWALGVLHELTDLGIWVLMVGPIRVIRRWRPAQLNGESV
jgi:hypothetical protein